MDTDKTPRRPPTAFGSTHLNHPDFVAGQHCLHNLLGPLQNKNYETFGLKSKNKSTIKNPNKSIFFFPLWFLYLFGVLYLSFDAILSKELELVLCRT